MIKEKDKLITTNRRKHSYNKDKTTKKEKKKTHHRTNTHTYKFIEYIFKRQYILFVDSFLH
jgi:hypothetical protein